MTQQEVQEVLDSLNKGRIGTWTEGQWNQARAASDYNKGNSGRAKKIAKAQRGKKAAYGRGKTYIELTTGYIGTLTDMARKFNIKYPSNFNQYVGKPMQRGAPKGLHFEIYTTDDFIYNGYLWLLDKERGAP